MSSVVGARPAPRVLDDTGHHGRRRRRGQRPRSRPTLERVRVVSGTWTASGLADLADRVVAGELIPTGRPMSSSDHRSRATSSLEQRSHQRELRRPVDGRGPAAGAGRDVLDGEPAAAARSTASAGRSRVAGRCADGTGGGDEDGPRCGSSMLETVVLQHGQCGDGSPTPMRPQPDRERARRRSRYARCGGVRCGDEPGVGAVRVARVEGVDAGERSGPAEQRGHRTAIGPLGQVRSSASSWSTSTRIAAAAPAAPRRRPAPEAS